MFHLHFYHYSAICWNNIEIKKIENQKLQLVKLTIEIDFFIIKVGQARFFSAQPIGHFFKWLMAKTYKDWSNLILHRTTTKWNFSFLWPNLPHNSLIWNQL